jgi:hypothetical protein
LIALSFCAALIQIRLFSFVKGRLAAENSPHMVIGYLRFLQVQQNCDGIADVGASPFGKYVT